MAPPTTVQIDLERRLAILENRARPKDRSIQVIILTVILTPILGGVGWWGFYITTNVIAMKQQLSDGGNKAIVASLEAPKSPALLKADLATVIASVQTAQANGTKANPVKTIPLSLAVDKIVKSTSPPAEAWQAASQLINFRSGSELSENLKACDFGVYKNNENLKNTPHVNPGADDGLRIDIPLQNCTLVIDDKNLAKILRDNNKSFLLKYGVPEKPLFIHYILTGVHVIYSGGEIEASTIQMSNCTFEIRTDSAPPSSGQRMIESLLETSDLDNVIANTLGHASGI